jgi:hypothetical protein
VAVDFVTGLSEQEETDEKERRRSRKKKANEEGFEGELRGRVKWEVGEGGEERKREVRRNRPPGTNRWKCPIEALSILRFSICGTMYSAVQPQPIHPIGG